MDLFLLQEAPVSWKTIKKSFLQKYGEEGLDNIAKSINFNSFREFYDDVYNTLYKDEGGQKYEPASTELIKIFKFLLENPKDYESIKTKLHLYGLLRYFGRLHVDSLALIKNYFQFKQFLNNLEEPEGDLKVNYQKYEKIYSDQRFDYYRIRNYEEMKDICVGTTWCVKEESWYETYTSRKGSVFFTAVAKNDWFSQNEFFKKKYSFRLPKIIFSDNEIEQKIEKIASLKDSNIGSLIDSENIDNFLRLYWYYLLNVTTYKDFYEEIKSAHKTNLIKADKYHPTGTLTYDGIPYPIIYRNKDRIESILEKLKETVKTVETISGPNIVNDFEKEMDKYFATFPNTDKMIKIINDVNNNNFWLLKKEFKDFLKKTDNDFKESEFNNNNQNIRIANFDKLPDPYHTMFKDFPPYKKYLKVREKLYENIEIIEEKINEFITYHIKFGVIKDYIKFNIITMLENVKRKRVDYYKEIINYVEDEIEKFDISDKMTEIDHFKVFEIKSKYDFKYFTDEPMSDVWDENSNFYYIEDTKNKNEFIFKMFKNDVYNEVISRLELFFKNMNIDIDLFKNPEGGVSDGQFWESHFDKRLSEISPNNLKGFHAAIKEQILNTTNSLSSKVYKEIDVKKNNLSNYTNSIVRIIEFYNSLFKPDLDLERFKVIIDHINDLDRLYENEEDKVGKYEQDLLLVSHINSHIFNSSTYSHISWRILKNDDDRLNFIKSLILTSLSKQLLFDFESNKFGIKDYSKVSIEGNAIFFNYDDSNDLLAGGTEIGVVKTWTSHLSLKDEELKVFDFINKYNKLETLLRALMNMTLLVNNMKFFFLVQKEDDISFDRKYNNISNILDELFYLYRTSNNYFRVILAFDDNIIKTTEPMQRFVYMLKLINEKGVDFFSYFYEFFKYDERVFGL